MNKSSKLAAVATGAFMATASSAMAWEMPTPLPFETTATVENGEADFTVQHEACTRDKHLLSIGFGVSVPEVAPNGKTLSASDAAELKDLYDNGIGADLNKGFNIAASLLSAEGLGETLMITAMMGGPDLNRLIAENNLSQDDMMQLQTEFMQLMQSLEANSPAFEAKLDQHFGGYGDAEPNGISFNVKTSALPSPKCL